LPKTTRTNPKVSTSHTNWHWLIKHPVEFSKNNHTPKTRPPLGDPISGHSFNFTRAISYRQIGPFFASAPRELARR
jgi:hypothetical protein